VDLSAYRQGARGYQGEGMNRTNQFTQIYAKVPTFRCKGLCQSNCSIISCSNWEASRAHECAQPNDVTDPYWCPFLSDGRCSIYEIRPLICRLYGAAVGLECPHGCEVDGELLTKKVAGELVNLSLSAGRGQTTLNSLEALETIVDALPKTQYRA